MTGKDRTKPFIQLGMVPSPRFAGKVTPARFIVRDGKRISGPHFTKRAALVALKAAR